MEKKTYNRYILPFEFKGEHQREISYGLTRIEYFATEAMKSIIAKQDMRKKNLDVHNITKQAWRIGESMFIESKKFIR